MENLEIEKKFLVRELPDLSSYTFHELEQGYLSTKPTVRVRKEDDLYYLTYKNGGGMIHEEYNLPLSRESYEHLLSKCDGRILSKTRYLIPYGKYRIELDYFHKDYEGLYFAEVEFNSPEEADAFVKPDWFSEEVTWNPSYRNTFLALQNDSPFLKADV